MPSPEIEIEIRSTAPLPRTIDDYKVMVGGALRSIEVFPGFDPETSRIDRSVVYIRVLSEAE